MAIVKSKKSGAQVSTKNKVRNINEFLKMARISGVDVSKEYTEIQSKLGAYLTKDGNVKQPGKMFELSKKEIKTLNPAEKKARRAELSKQKRAYEKNLNKAYTIYTSTVLNNKTAYILGNFYTKINDPEKVSMKDILDYVKHRDQGKYKELLKHLSSSEITLIEQKINKRATLNDDIDWFNAASAGKIFNKELFKQFITGKISRDAVLAKLS